MGLGQWIPYRWRWVHHVWANLFGYFWLPCRLCSKPFGGHEWRDRDGLSGSIVTDDGTFGICPQCTVAGRGSNYSPPGEKSL